MLKTSFLFIVFEFIIVSLAVGQSLEAPYLSFAQSDYNLVKLSWRNNDIKTEKIIILRRVAQQNWVSITTVKSSVLTYNDSSVISGAQNSYALIGSGAGLSSDTSNIIQVMVPLSPTLLKAPKISSLWDMNQKSVVITYIDSSNIDSSYLLYRRQQLSSEWMRIDSLKCSNPRDMGELNFKDIGLAANTWYFYKVAVTNGKDTLFSDVDTVYNYQPPKKSNSYSMKRLDAIPAKPISWIERIGDSLFFPEIRGEADTAITVLNISDANDIKFDGYLDIQNMDNRKIPAEVKAKILFNENCWKINGYFLKIDGNSGYFNLSLYDLETLSQKDTASFRADMPAFVNNVISMNDSVAFILLSYNGSMRSSYFYLLPIMIRQNKIKVFAVMDLGSGRDLIFEFRGGIRNKIVYILRSKLIQLDYSQSIEQPLKFEYGYDGGLVYNQNFNIKDDLVCGYKGDSQSGMQFCFYNIFDASVSKNTNLGSFRDVLNVEYIMKSVLVDSVKSRIIMAGENSIMIYGYESIPVGVKTPKTSLSALKNSSLKMQIFAVSGKIRIANSRFAPERIRILGLNGKLVAESYIKASAHTNGHFAEFNMRRLPAGVYLCSVEKLSENIQTISKVQIP